MENGHYTTDEVIGILANLVNGIGLCAKENIMPERYKQKVEINGENHWVTGKSLKDLLEAYLTLCIEEGTVVPGFLKREEKTSSAPLVENYIREFNELYKSKQESLTKNNREYVVKNHIIPRFGQKHLDEVSTNDIQAWFNELDEKGYSHETLLKIRNTFSPVLDSAVEDGYIPRNPFSSKRLIIAGAPTEHHKAIPTDLMKSVREKIPDISDVKIRCMLALLSFTAMRMEEVLGLRWEDLDFEENWIYIKRAVVHPTRNQGEVKEPKTKTSIRRIPFPNELKKYFKPRYDTGFILFASKDFSRETPMGYTEARNIFRKIQKMCNLKEYSAHDFRDTCATEWREAGIPTDVIAHLLGHSKSDITENRYVKYRDELYQGVRDIMNGPKPTD